MSADVFERNVGKLVRAAELPPTDAAAAKERFLRVAGPKPSRSRGVALAAAATLIGALIYAATLPRTESPEETGIARPRQEEPPLAFTSIPLSGGTSSLKGTFKVSSGRRPARILRFEGASPFPDETAFAVSVTRREERLVAGGSLVARQETEHAKTVVLQKGVVDLQWESSHSAFMTVRVAVRDQDQEVPVLQQIRIPESERVWTFTVSAWDRRILSLLEPQLAEVTALARELRDLIDRVEATSVSEERFTPMKKSLSAEASKLRSRAEGLQKAGLYPAAALEIANIAQDLNGAMDIFTWKDGKFDGPRSYYTNNERGKTRRGEVWDFEPLRRHVETAVVAAGREFGLWIIAERARGGAHPEIVEAVARSEKRPGVAEFADRLKGEPDPMLTDDLRRIK